MKPLLPIATRESPRQILAEDFKQSGELPIRGGWGYTRDDACIIEKNDPVNPRGIPFDGLSVEYAFVEKRIYEEMIIFREEGEKFAGIEWKLLMQMYVQGTYDQLVFEITAFPEDAWNALKEEWDGPSGFGNPSFDREAHDRKRDQSKIRITREFWFDISSFFGTSNQVVATKSIESHEQYQATDHALAQAGEWAEEFNNDPSDPDYMKMPPPEEDTAVAAFHAAVDQRAKEIRKAPMAAMEADEQYDERRRRVHAAYPPPKREDYEDEEEYLEARDYYRTRIAPLMKRPPDSLDESK